MNKRNAVMLLSFLAASCGGKKSNNAPAPSNLSSDASCQILHMGGISPLDAKEDSTAMTPVVACFESKTQLTENWCETSGVENDKDRHFYRLFKGETSCPTDNLVGKCVYPASDSRREAVTVWYYSNPELTTDYDLLRKGCNYGGMYFSLK